MASAGHSSTNFEATARPTDQQPDGVGPQGGTSGAAVNRREPVFVSDFLTDPILEQVRDVIAAHGIRACWSAPILSDQGEILDRDRDRICEGSF